MQPPPGEPAGLQDRHEAAILDPHDPGDVAHRRVDVGHGHLAGHHVAHMHGPPPSVECVTAWIAARMRTKGPPIGGFLLGERGVMQGRSRETPRTDSGDGAGGRYIFPMQQEALHLSPHLAGEGGGHRE